MCRGPCRTGRRGHPTQKQPEAWLMPANPSSAPADRHIEPWRDLLAARYAQVRAHTTALAAPLSAEDQCIQSMPDATPTKWHLAHTSWFFEAVVLAPHMPGYEPFDARFSYLFNSYYESLGPRHARPQRGMLTRPGLPQVHAYRDHVAAAMLGFIAGA